MHWWSSILSFFSVTLLQNLSDSEEKDSALRGIVTLMGFPNQRIIKVRVLYILSVLALCWIRLPQKHLYFFWWSKLFTSYCFSVLFPLCHCTKCFLQKLSKWIPPVVHTIEWFREGTFFIGGGGGWAGASEGRVISKFFYKLGRVKPVSFPTGEGQFFLARKKMTPCRLVDSYLLTNTRSVWKPKTCIYKQNFQSRLI